MIIVLQTMQGPQGQEMLQLTHEGAPSPEVVKAAMETAIKEILDKQIAQSKLILPQAKLPDIRDILGNNGDLGSGR